MDEQKKQEPEQANVSLEGGGWYYYYVCEECRCQVDWRMEICPVCKRRLNWDE